MNNKDLLNRIYFLGGIIYSAGGEIIGRKRMQKIIFLFPGLLKKKPFYDFNWNYYGVYSSELSSDIQQAIALNAFEENAGIDGYGNITYTIKIKEPNDKFKALSEREKTILSSLNDLDVRILEIISSIYYFRSQGYNDSKVKQLLNVHKGHLQNQFRKAYSKLAEIENLCASFSRN